MKALFICEFKNGYPVLPPMESDILLGGLQLHFTEGGVLKGGYSCVGLVPQTTTAIMQVEASPATIAAMQASPEYFFLGEVVDAAII